MLGKANKIFISMIGRHLYAGSSMLGPVLVMSSDEYGQYALFVSAVLIIGAILDFGIGFKSMATSLADKELINKSVHYLIYRDIVLAFCFIAYFLMSKSQVAYIFLCAIVVTSSISWLGVVRGKRNAEVEVYYSSSMNIIFFISFAFVHILDYKLEVNVAIFLFVVMPRLIPLPFVIYANRIIIHKGIGGGVQDLKEYFPFWVQTSFSTATTNLDVIVASTFLSISDVGAMKVIVLMLGVGLIIPDVIGNILLTKMVNHDISWSVIKITRNKILIYIIAAGGIAGLISLELTNVPLELFALSFLFITLLYFRIMSLNYAISLTVNNKQSLRVVVMVGSNVIYWAMLIISLPTMAIHGFFLSILISSLFQFVAYYSLARVK